MGGADSGATNCLENLESLSLYLDGDLDEATSRLIEEHSRDCAPCRAFQRTLHRTIDMVGSEDSVQLSVELKRRIVEALLEARKRRPN